jgi:predicted ester cyclase
VALLGNFMSPQVVNHELADAFGESGPSQGHNIHWIADLIYLYRHAFPDLRFEIQDQIAERDQVVTCLRMQGTHTNDLMRIGPSGKKVDIAGIRVDRIAGGRIVESWAHLDALGMLRQIDALPELNRGPQKLAPVSYETAPGAGLPDARWSSIPALPQPAFVS